MYVVLISIMCEALARRHLVRICPNWKIVRSAKYLGMFVGENVEILSWPDAMVKYVARCLIIRDCTAGLMFSIRMYACFAFSCLRYVANCRKVPAVVLKKQRECSNS